MIFIQSLGVMTLKEILQSEDQLEHRLPGTVSVDETAMLSRPLTLEGEQTVVLFPTSGANIRLTGYGPFRFRGLTFRHDQELGVSFFLCQDASVVFEDCTFEGAYGGSEDSLAAAVTLKGKAQVQFERCHFQDNDLHLVVAGDSRCRANHTVFKAARADGMRCFGAGELDLKECEVQRSGWNGVSAQDNSALSLNHCTLSGNGCNGLELLGASRYQGTHNVVKENGHNGISAANYSTLVADHDRVYENYLCGLDLGDNSNSTLRDVHTGHNLEHGCQMRDHAKAVMRDCVLEENGKSGLAMFGETSLQAEDLTSEMNFYGGVQCADSARLNLDRANVNQNQITGLACFGRSRVMLERSRLNDCGGHGVQFTDHSYGFLRDCEIMENHRSAVVFAGHSRGAVEANTLAHNKASGLITSDQSKVTAIENLIRSNARDGALILSRAACQLLENLIERNGRYGIYAGPGARPLLSDNLSEDNSKEQVVLETNLGRSANRGATKPDDSSDEIPAGVTLSMEDGGKLHLPFQPKKVEKTLLLALAKHGRLTEAALGKVAKSRRVGGAMENLIDRLNKAGMPVIRHDGDGPEGIIYAFKLDMTRVRKNFQRRDTNNQQTQGREIC